MADVTVYSAPWCPHCRRVKRFLSEQRVAYDLIDVDADASGLAALTALQGGGRTIPTVVFGDGTWEINPSDGQLAERIGLRREAARASYDVVIVGGGPAGLSAAIYAAREGMDAVVLDRSAMGGQAAITDRVDNYPGFPDGIGGAELTDRFVEQARRYGVELLPAVECESIAAEDDDVVVRLSTGQEISAHAGIIATGSTYRRLGVPGEDDLVGAGVHFCATCDGPLYKGAEELLVIGGGNSALEEGMHLSGFANRVRVLQRGPALTASQILQDRVRDDPKFEVHLDTVVTELVGEGGLREVVARDKATGEELRFHPAAAFVFIGLDPNTDFLRGSVALDEWGFVTTSDTFETSVPGVFAAGDVRAGATKQIASAVGDGITALLMVRRHLERHHHLAKVAVDA
jgi:thioredoxin reductase (NADPH)